MAFIYAVDQVTNEFVYGGMEPYDCAEGLSEGQIRVVTDRIPDFRGDRYSGDPADPIRVATAEEIAAYDAAILDAQVQALYVGDTKATVLWALERILGHAPSEAEAATAQSEWKIIRQSLV